eukprot:GFKZ01002986.1.p1 GENE.GFKZ01002986.1~~GFKZ01002986.1.p1  ORF type:complete len:348 (+),score=27.82 GFKZ01002986.1:315-1358(+)
MQESTIIFNAPNSVQVIQSPLHPAPPEHVSVRTLYTAISPGTELLIFTDTFPTTLPADSVIPSQSKPFSYPSPYGYCLVGQVTTPEPPPPLLPNQLVFSFHHHTSHFHTSSSQLHPVPPDISPPNATFLPSLETAVSLATDAALLPGESVTVVGQGIIGLLLVSVLKRLHPFSTVIALEPNPSRLKVSLRHANPDFAFDPLSRSFPSNFQNALSGSGGTDVSIDVSGTGSGLETAINCTRDHGRVVMGSWYGRKHVTLTTLGGRFHRSHITLIASQVSGIPVALQGRWTKQRRFRLAWDLLREIKPADCFPIHILRLEDAQRAYEGLCEGQYLQVLFKYSEDNCEQS